MSNWTEDDLRKLGFEPTKDKRRWKQRASIPSAGDPGELSEPKRAAKRKTQPKTKDGPQEAGGAKSARRPRFRLRVTAYRTKHSDTDDLVPKWYIDAIKNRGLMPNDSSEYIIDETRRIVVGKGEPKTVIEVIRDD